MRRFSTPISRIAPLPDEARPLRRLGNLHWGPLVAALLLAAIGLATVHSASSELAVDFMPRQALWIALGLMLLVLAFAVDYHVAVDLAPIFYGITLLLLVAVLIVGRDVAGHRSWLALGPVGGQPSELAKPATALLLARYLGRVQRPHLSILQLTVVGVLVGVPMLLVVLEGDLGSALMFVPMAAAVVLVAGVRLRLLAVLLLLAAVAGAGVWSFGLRDYQRQRIASFVSPESDPLGAGYQVRQSKIAVGSGHWWGRGYGQGTQSQLRFLPARHTDFIMAVLAEEWGFAGVMAVLALYSLYLASCVQVAARSRDRAGILMVTGLVALVAFHVLYNTAMVIGLMPITGIPLPFLSYGGSFMLANFLITGLVLNVDYRRYVNR
ncbi:MAG: rod shape-determining protein RodA [Acidobacteria bacterium]|nr:MAG: rod shape-determining protein RodA [Acidobacteriota bacterium]